MGGNGQRRDLTDELLMPLRTGQRHPYSSKPRQQDMEYQDAPKRKVGYQSRSNQQGQQQQQYYDQQGGRYGGGGYRRGSYDPNRSRRGYEDAPYPPSYGNYRRPQYDAYYEPRPMDIINAGIVDSGHRNIIMRLIMIKGMDTMGIGDTDNNNKHRGDTIIIGIINADMVNNSNSG